MEGEGRNCGGGGMAIVVGKEWNRAGHVAGKKGQGGR